MPKKAFEDLPEWKKEEISTKTMELYVGAKYEKVTLQLILDALDIHPMTFYRYFSDKDELYLYLHRKTVGKHELVVLSETNSSELDIFTFHQSIKGLSELEVDFMNTFKSVPKEILSRAYFEIFKDGLSGRYKAGLEKLRLQGNLRPEVNEDLISFMFATTMYNMILFFREYDITDADAQKKLKKYFYLDFFRRGILKNPDEEGESN